ncbi:Homeodomain-like protein [Choanephora cucurbitarum]|uniref:Homeobox protein 10 n=1 Tax=Choanephora cucurbitarum TaxID=101091 RepID=A0A1C7NEY1_9FUNG|nr:Homeodomain-like protein [Choanephora cucurbitarum]OBZ85884.1 Homeobox protein 10 [Choanephora cucurbitarum]
MQHIYRFEQSEELIRLPPILKKRENPLSIDSLLNREPILLPPLHQHTPCRPRPLFTVNHHRIVTSLSKGKRKRILPYQYNRLVQVFDQTDTPSSEKRGQLAEELDMTKREVQVWFQNRRAKIKMQQKHYDTTQHYRHNSFHHASQQNLANIHPNPAIHVLTPVVTIANQENYKS